MKSLRPLLLIALVAALPSLAQAAEADEAAIERGRNLFLHEFQPDDALTPDGDGLGPMHNANSCVACHSQGGVGGAGGLEQNVDLIGVVTPRLRSDVQGRFAQHVSDRVHPLLNQSTPNTVLHAASTQEGYTLLRQRALGIPIREGMSEGQQRRVKAAAERRMKRQGNLVNYETAGIPMEWSQRQTPALFGLGEIDRIPRKLLEEIAKRQEATDDGVSGRLAGRFGWRGQTETLSEFVLGACANELGLQCGEHGQARDPQRPEYEAPGDDLSVEQQNDLIAYVSSLPAPQALDFGNNSLHKAQIEEGKELFATIGCATCHVPDVGNAVGIFSDLLLHDMGPALADSIAAPPMTSLPSQPQQMPSFGYFGFSSPSMFAAIPSNTRQEWRTPPLWGVAASAPYLHDGRAPTLDAAIRMHGGEGEASVANYHKLDGPSQRKLLVFLKSLDVLNAEQVIAEQVQAGDNELPSIDSAVGFGSLLGR